MKKLRKLLIVLLAVMIASALCSAVLAEGETATEAPATSAPTETANAEAKSVGVVRVTDGEGNDVYSTSGLGCLSSGVSFFIKHEYVIVLGYVEGSKAVETEDQIIISIENDENNVTFEHNTVRISASDRPFTFILKYKDETVSGGIGTYTIPISRFKFDMTDIIVAAIGVYVIVSAVRGGGALFNDEFIKEDKKEQFKKLSRLLSIAAGAVFLISAAISICFSYLDWVKIAKYVCFGIGALCLIGLIVINSLMTDKEKRQKAQQTAGTGGGTATIDAFEFDGTEPTLDEVLADLEKQKAEDPGNKNEQ